MAVLSGSPGEYELVVGARLEEEGTRPGLAASGSSAWRRFWGSRVTHIAGPLLLLVVWQLIVSVGHAPADQVPAPWTVLKTLNHLSATGVLWTSLEVSLRRVVFGLLLGITVGSALALLSGLTQVGERLIDPVMHMFRTMPVLALAPLFTLWFGIGEEAKVLLIAWAVAFPIYINLYAGVRGVDSRLLEAGRVLGLKRAGQIRHVILPGALPEFLTGLRLALAIAWIVLVAAEEINATSGLGYLLTNAENLLQTNVIFATLFVYSLLGVGTDLLVRLIERWALAWRSSYMAR